MTRRIFDIGQTTKIDVLRAIDDDKCVILLLLDLSAAFDMVDHGILLSRLSMCYESKALYINGSGHISATVSSSWLSSLQNLPAVHLPVAYHTDLFLGRSCICCIPLLWVI